MTTNDTVTYRQLLMWVIPICTFLVGGCFSFFVMEGKQNDRIRTLEIRQEVNGEHQAKNGQTTELIYQAVKSIETRLIRLEVKEELKEERQNEMP